MDIREISEAIRNSISTIDVAKALGLNLDRHGRCSCPFHHGTDRNMKCYPGNRGYYCFVCHKGGDCISLVQGVVPDIGYADAMWWINDYFKLGYSKETKKPSIRQRARRAMIRSATGGVKHEAEH